MVSRFIRWLAPALALVTPFAATAHPHVWVDTESAFIFDGQNRVSAIRIVWRFDELYSAFAIQGADADQDGETTQAELDHQAGFNRQHLAEWRYFTEMKVGTADAEYGDVTEFGGRNEDGILVYWYVLPLEFPVDPRKAPIRFRTSCSASRWPAPSRPPPSRTCSNARSSSSRIRRSAARSTSRSTIPG